MHNNASIELKCAVVSIDPQGFLRMTMRETNEEIDLLEAKLHVQAALELTVGAKMPVLIDARFFVSITKDAREYISKNDIVQGKRLAEAFLVSGLAAKIMAKVYIIFHKPENPHKIFTNEMVAIDWLLKYKV